jgi:hypothetical protein
VPVRVDHPRHHDPAGRVDLDRPGGRLEVRADRRDPVVLGEDVRIGQHALRVVHHQHRRPAQQHRRSRTLVSHLASFTSVVRADVRPLSGHWLNL